MIQNHPVIALEEHYWHTDVVKKSGGDAGAHRGPDIVTRLNEIGPMRIATMDEAGIDVQVLGHGMPATQRMDAESAVRLARISNDYVAEKCKPYPTPALRLRQSADARPESRGRRARAHRHQARLQGRDGARAEQRHLPRRRALLAGLGARRRARRADLHASRDDG